MAYFILIGLLFFYFVWTLTFAIKFNNTDNYFEKGQKRLHNILIWVLPFIWIIVIKTITKPTPGSHALKKKQEEDSFYESKLGQ